MQSWFPENVSTFGADVDGIFWFIFYIVTIWFFLTEGLILYFVFRYRRKPGQKAVYAAGDTWAQLAWVLVPMAIVVVLDLFIDIRSADVWAKVKLQRPPTDFVVALFFLVIALVVLFAVWLDGRPLRASGQPKATPPEPLETRPPGRAACLLVLRWTA